MTENNLKKMQVCFNLTEREVNELIKHKDHDSRFVLYIAALDHYDSASATFKCLGYNLHTKVDNIRGYNSPYEVLLKNNVFGRDEKQLFHFIVHRLCRDILDKNLPLL